MLSIRVQKEERAVKTNPWYHGERVRSYINTCWGSGKSRCKINGNPATSLIQENDGSISGALATNGNGDSITIHAQSTIYLRVLPQMMKHYLMN